MSTLQQKYKEKISGFAGATEHRRTRIEKHEELRKKQRSKAFNENRNISSSLTNKSENKEVQSVSGIQRSDRLMKWKAEREKQRLAQLKKRPPFIVGKVHHKIYSPISSDQTIALKVHKQTVSKPPALQPSAPPPKKITRATEKRLLNKALMKQMENSVNKPPKSINKEQKSKKKEAQSFAPSDHKFKAPEGLLPVFGKVAVQNMSQESIKRLSNNKMNDTSIVNREEDADDSHDSSIESIALKVSFDGTFTCSNENDNDDANKAETQNNSVRDNGATETVSSKDSSTPKDSLNEPAFFSPYVVSSRGKNNARKEQQLKRGFSLNHSQSDDIPTKDTIMKALNISVEEEERTAQYFRFLLNREIDGLNELCKKWADIKEDATTTEDGQYEINQAIGQTNLLINKKFERFRKLVADCETGKGEMLVTCKDLQGFWDMMYMEVKDCDARFERLEKLRSQNWIEEQPSVPKMKPVVKKKNVTKKKAVPNKVSSLKAFLAGKKKNISQKASSDDSAGTRESINKRHSKNMHENNQNDSNMQSKTRRSSVFRSSISTDHQQARSSRLSKSRLPVSSTSYKSPLTLIKISQMSKTPDIQLDDTISYINSNQTPGKSILKAAKTASEIKSTAKSIKVNFNDHVVSKEVPDDEEHKLKSDLSGVLDSVNRFHFESPDEVVINAERKLNFDDSLDESTDDTKENVDLNSPDRTFTNISFNETQAAILLKYPELSGTNNTPKPTPSPTKQLKRQDAVNESDQELTLNVTLTRLEDVVNDANLNTSEQKSPRSPGIKEETIKRDESIRILRNRIITPIDTTKRRRRSSKKINVSVDVQDSEHKENKTPMRTRRKSSVKVIVEDKEKKDSQNSADKTASTETNNKRKSRRSVRFSENDCSGCVPNKTPLPMTPHVRRSRAKSAEKKKSTIPEDLITWKTPETLPDRVRRPQSKKKDTPI